MRNILLLVACAILAPATSFAAEAPGDFLVIPGDRAGLITSQISEADLVRQLPKGYVKRTFYEESWVGNNDAPLRCVSRIYPASAKEIWIVWKSDLQNNWDVDALPECLNAPSLSAPAYILLATTNDVFTPEGSESPWKMANGIGLGTTLSALEEANGKPVTFSIGADTDGNITGWNEGQLGSSIKAAMLVYQDPDMAGQLRQYADNKTDEQSGEVKSSDIPAELKAKIKLALFTVALAK